MRQIWNVGTNNYVCDYIYDHNGIPMAFALSTNGGVYEYYFYETNLHGDITAVYDSNGAQVVRFAYDAWGSFQQTGNISEALSKAILFRYRSYIYDSEIGLYYLQSRYYDPVVGRFINVDNIIPNTIGSLHGYNLYSYCFNNPVNLQDQGGNWPEWMKNAIKWTATNVVMPVVDFVEEKLSNVDATYSTGINASGTPSAWIFNGQIGISVDTKGNVAIQAAGAGGVTTGTPSISLTRYSSITNAPSIDKLNGEGYQIGGSGIVPIYGIPFAFGGDYNIIPDNTSGDIYQGITATGGIGLGHGGEFHMEWGATTTVKQTKFNIFDSIEKYYIKLMEW